MTPEEQAAMRQKSAAAAEVCAVYSPLVLCQCAAVVVPEIPRDRCI